MRDRRHDHGVRVLLTLIVVLLVALAAARHGLHGLHPPSWLPGQHRSADPQGPHPVAHSHRR